MILEYTPQEQEQLKAIEERYDSLLEAKAAEMETLRDSADSLANYTAGLSRIESTDDPETRTAKTKALEQAYKDWIAAGSPEWRRARDEYIKLQEANTAEITNFIATCEARYMAQFCGDPAQIYEDAKGQAKRIIEQQQLFFPDSLDNWGTAIPGLVTDGENVRLNAESVKRRLRSELYLHYKELAKYPEYIEKLNKAIDELLTSSPAIASGGALEDLLQSFTTRKPTKGISLLDKISGTVFSSELQNRKQQQVGMKKTTVALTIDWSNLDNVTLSNPLDQYDKEILQAFAAYHLSGNTFITTNDIYRYLYRKDKVKDRGKHTEKQEAEILESIDKLQKIRVRVNYTDEANRENKQLLKLDSLEFEGALLLADKITAKKDGNTVTGYKLHREPFCLSYIQKKRQLSTYDLALRATPINKNKEIIALEGYLVDRIAPMKGDKKNQLSRKILYETIYSQLKIDASTPAALRKKKEDIRKKTATILEHFKAQGWISGYEEERDKRNKNAAKAVIIQL